MAWDDDQDEWSGDRSTASKDDGWSSPSHPSDRRGGDWGGRRETATAAAQEQSIVGSSHRTRRGDEGASSGVKIALIGAVATLLAAVIGAVVLIVTDDPPPPPPPRDPTAQVGDIVEASMSVGQPCCTFSVQVGVVGYLDKTLALESSIVDATTGQQSTPDVQQLRVTADSDRANPDVKVDIRTPGTYYMVFVLKDPNGTTLDRSQTSVFPVY